MSATTGPRTQEQRSAQTKARLIDAAATCLVELGYAHTTTVEICSRAEMTRGAYNHHYAELSDLFSDVIDRIGEQLATPENAAETDATLEALVREGWSRVQKPEFKAIIELWLAARNDRLLGASLSPALERLNRLFDPGSNPALAKLLENGEHRIATYRLAFETMIGLAFGRATSPNERPVGHESQVLELLFSIVRERELNPAGAEARNPA